MATDILRGNPSIAVDDTAPEFPHAGMLWLRVHPETLASVLYRNAGTNKAPEWVQVGDSPNLLANPSFETGDLTGWLTFGAGGTATAVADAAATHGDWVAEVDDTSATDPVNLAQDVAGAAAEGDVFTLSADVVSHTGDPLRMLIAARDSGALATVGSLDVSSTGRHTLTSSPCPAGTTTVRVVLTGTAGNVVTARVDAVQLERGDTATDFWQ